jgi:hypothetical protein
LRRGYRKSIALPSLPLRAFMAISRVNLPLIIIIIIIIMLPEAVQIPEWLTAGITFLIPKNENTEHPKNYRPVTCLPTTYELLTSIKSRRMQQYMDVENLIPKEQKG